MPLVRGGSEVADLVLLWHAVKRNLGGFKTTDPRLYQDQWQLVAPPCQASLHTVYTLSVNYSQGTRLGWAHIQYCTVNLGYISLTYCTKKTQRNDPLQCSSTT